MTSLVFITKKEFVDNSKSGQFTVTEKVKKQLEIYQDNDMLAVELLV